MSNNPPMYAFGKLYIGKHPNPMASTDASGQFQLTFDALDCLGPHAKECWTLIWAGPRAAQFWDAYAAALRTPGQPISVSTSHMRCHLNGRVPGIHAHVEALALAPRYTGPTARAQLVATYSG